MNFLQRHKLLISALGLVVVFILGATYLVVGIMQINPLKSTYAVTVELNRSGGLQVGNPVTYRGVPVGKVASIEFTDTGVAAKAEIDSSEKIPQGGHVAVRALSSAGVQFLDFQPDVDKAPYLADGQKIPFNPDTTTTPAPFAEVLENSTHLIKNLDPEKFQVIINELDKALGGGSVELKTLVQGASITMAGLDGLLPQTTGLIENLRTIMGTTEHAQPDLQTLTRNSKTLFNQLNASNAELEKLFNTGPAQVAAFGDVTKDLTDPSTKLVNNFVAVVRAAKLRTPALMVLFPSLRDGLGALGSTVRDGEVKVVADILPRPYCDYATVPRSPEKLLTDLRVRLYNYCESAIPGIQVRGARNAPRPNIPDNTSGMPAGVDPNAVSNPAPPAPGH